MKTKKQVGLEEFIVVLSIIVVLLIYGVPILMTKFLGRDAVQVSIVSLNEDKLRTEFHKNLKYYAFKNIGGLPSIYYMLRLGYPKQEEDGTYSSMSISSRLVNFFKANPVKAFDTIASLYKNIQTIIGNDSHFYSILAFYIEAISEVDFNWKVIKNPTYLNSDYNSYSELIFADPQIEALGAKRDGYFLSPFKTHLIVYRDRNRLRDMKWRMIKFFHRRGPVLSHLAGFYMLKILKNEAKENEKAIPFYSRSHEFFAEKYNNFASSWNAGEKTTNPYQGTDHKYHLFEFIDITLPVISDSAISLANENFKLDIDFILETGKGERNYSYDQPKYNFCGQYYAKKIKFWTEGTRKRLLADMASESTLNEIPTYGYDSGEELVVVLDEDKPIFILRGTSVSFDCYDITNNGKPDLVAEVYSGGAGCCDKKLIIPLDDHKGPIFETRYLVEFEDLDSDGSKELIGFNPSFRKYSSFPNFYMPKIISCYKSGKYQNCSSKFPAIFRKELDSSLKSLRLLNVKNIDRDDQMKYYSGEAVRYLVTGMTLGEEGKALETLQQLLPSKVFDWLSEEKEKIRMELGDLS